MFRGSHVAVDVVLVEAVESRVWGMSKILRVVKRMRRDRSLCMKANRDIRYMLHGSETWELRKVHSRWLDIRYNWGEMCEV